MRILTVITCAALVAAASLPAAAHTCGRSRCAPSERYAAARFYAGRVALTGCCCRAPAGWGYYLRQKLRSDCAAPLAISDELGGVTLVRDRK